MNTYNAKVLAVVNQKGGVGKTTLVSVISEYMSIIQGKNVLIADLDMQCNTSDGLVGMQVAPQHSGGQLPPLHPDYDGDPLLEERSSIADIFYGKAVLPHPTYINKDNGYPANVDVMVGHPGLLELINTEHDNRSGNIATKIVNRLAEFLHLPEVAEEYDLIILDTGPSRNPIFRAAIRAATHIVIPFEPEEKSIQGINAMIQIMQAENFSRPDNDQIIPVGLCPNKVRKTKLHTGSLDAIYENLPKLAFPRGVHLPLSTAFPERDLKGISPKSIYQISQDHAARRLSEAVGEFVYQSIFRPEVNKSNGSSIEVCPEKSAV